MKKVVFLIVMLFACTTLFSQVSMDTTKLSDVAKQEIRNELKRQAVENQVKSNVKQVSEWTGMGKEIGEAVNGGLEAITNNVDKVGNTKVGKFTMILIAYKVLGRQLIACTVLPIFMIIFLFLFIWLVKKFAMPFTYKVKDAVKDDKGKIVEPAEYKVAEPDYMINARAWLIGVFIAIEMLMIAIMFGVS